MSSSRSDHEQTPTASSSKAEAAMEEYMRQYMEENNIYQYFLQAILQHTCPSRRYVQRNRERAHQQLMGDYYYDNPIWGGPNVFRRCFRMRKKFFTNTTNALESHNTWFQQRVDAVENKGFTLLQKYTNVIRQLAYGGPVDHYDEHLHIFETTRYEFLRHFCRDVIEVFDAHYLRKSIVDEYLWLMEMHEQKHDFPRMLGSLDYMYWTWKNCPVAWNGQFTSGDHGVPTVMLEVVASQDLWI